METQVFDFKFKSFEESLKLDNNIKWYVHSSKYYEIYQENCSLFSLIFVIVIYSLLLN